MGVLLTAGGMASIPAEIGRVHPGVPSHPGDLLDRRQFHPWP